MEAVRGNYFVLNGSFYEANLLKEFLNSNSIQIYEVFRIFNSKPVFLDDHIERLKLSFIGIGQKVSKEFYEKILRDVKRLIEKNSIDKGNIKILIQLSDNIIQIFIFFIPHFYPSKQDYINGVDVGLFEAIRQKPNIKAITNVKDNINSFLKEKKLYEVLLVNENGRITEGSRTNVFFINYENHVITAPDDSVLKGVTRKYVVQICEMNDIPLLFRKISVNELKNFQSIFLTGTSPKILPIKKIENITFDVNSVLLRRIMKDYESNLSSFEH